MSNELTYKYGGYDDKGNPILKTYWNGDYIGECVAYWIGRDVMMAYPRRR